MLVIEKVLDKIKDIDTENKVSCAIKNIVFKYEGGGCPEYNCNECLKRTLIELAKEYKEPTKLTRFEYDLLDSYTVKGFGFEACGILSKMYDKGYFKGVKDTSMSLHDILENCVVVDDED